MQVGLNVLLVLRHRAVDIARDVQVVIVFDLDFLVGNKAGILGIVLDLLVEGRDDLVNILFPQAVLVAVLHIAVAGVDHENAAPARCFVSEPLFQFLVGKPLII